MYAQRNHKHKKYVSNLMKLHRYTTLRKTTIKLLCNKHPMLQILETPSFIHEPAIIVLQLNNVLKMDNMLSTIIPRLLKIIVSVMLNG